jgi:amino acid adenylation domain-containing protein
MNGSSPLPPVSLDASIITRFRQVSRHDPSHPAITDGTQQVTYAELDAWSDRIAQQVFAELGPDAQPIALSFNQGIPAVAAMLGVLKAGHFYAVVDPAMPTSRARTVLENLQAGCVMIEGATAMPPEQCAGLRVLACPALSVQASTLPDHTLALATPDTLAAIYYTSGTTGAPKGVIFDHALILHRAYQDAQVHPIGATDVVAALFSPAYASSAGDIFGALLHGATLAIGRAAQQDAADLRDWLVANRVTVLHLHAGILRQLLATLPDGFCFNDLRLVRPAGGTLVADIHCLRRHLLSDALILHQLASSETSLVSRFVLRADTDLSGELMPVGYPIDTAQVTLIETNGQPLQEAGAGEIEVRSRYLARGYWNQPELTAQRFRTDPQDPRYRIYRMGDLARRHPDGMLELLGRSDRRVKIRSYTVDLEAVESVLARLPGVNEAVVVAKTTAHDAILIAYVCMTDAVVDATTVDATTADRSVTALRAALVKELPAHMLPARFVFLDALPRLSNGKVDRASLPPPGRSRPGLDTPYVAPRSELEQQFADIWAQVLDLDEVGIADSFFDLGGDSLTTMAMLLKVEQYTGCTVPRAFLRNPTIATIVGLLAGGEAEPPLDPASSTRTANMPLRQTAGSGRLPGLLRPLARGVENRIFEHPLGMPYQEGMRWLRGWAGQPLVQRIRYAQQRRLFRAFAESFDSPLADDTDAFAEAILNSIWGQYIRQLGLGRPMAEYVTALQNAPWQFWRDLGDQLAAGLRDPAGPVPFAIAGKALLQDAIRQGRGVILAAPHLPALGVYKIILASLGIVPHSMTGAAFREARAELTAVSTSSPLPPHRRVQRTHELLRARELLMQGEVVYIPIDSAAGVGPRIYTPVGRRLFPFNVGAIELALATGAPLLPVTTLLQPDNRLRLTIAAPLAVVASTTGDPQAAHDERVWIAAQACGEFLASLWREAPYARTWGDMRHYLAVSRSPDQAKPGSWMDFDKRLRVSHDAA